MSGRAGDDGREGGKRCRGMPRSGGGQTRKERPLAPSAGGCREDAEVGAKSRWWWFEVKRRAYLRKVERT